MTCLIAQYFLNHRLEPGEIERQVRQLATAGYQGVYAHARAGLLTPYMSEDWWRAIDTIVEMCRRYGLELWIWDEDYYPSGLAGGRVVWEEPGLIGRGLEFSITDIAGKGPFELDFAPGLLLRAFALPRCGAVGAGLPRSYGEPQDVTSFCGTRRQGWAPRHLKHSAYSPAIDPIGHPHWRSSMEDNRFALSWRPAAPGEYTVVAALVASVAGAHPDILRPEAVGRFLELSYEPYFRRYGGEFGKLVPGAFTDEPSPGGPLYPWTPAFPEEFQADHGYDLLPHLAHLAVDMDERSAAVRHHYRLTQQRLQEQSYTGQIGRWCEQHGIQAVGHLTRTEWLSLAAAWWPNELRCYRPLHIPCADPLGASIGWPEAAAYHTGLKVASSAAHLFGRAQAGSDALGVVGDEAGLRDLKYQLDYQMALGINHFSIHGLHYSLEGPRKDEAPPSLFYQHSEWKHMPLLLDHVRHTCEALTGGEHVCELAVLYPATSLACQLRPEQQRPGPSGSSPSWRSLPDEALVHALVEQLLSHQRDFDFIDELTLQESVDDAGRLSTPEPYRVIVLPHLRYIDERTAAALLRFAGAGGKVMAIGSLPLALGRTLAEPQRQWADERIAVLASLDEASLRELPGVDVRGRGASDIFVLRRRKEDELLTFVVNRGEEHFSGRADGVTVDVPPRGSALLANGGGNDWPTRRPLTLARQLLADWGNDWTVEFEPNQMPLNFWHVTRGEAATPPCSPPSTGDYRGASPSTGDYRGESPFSAPGFDLMSRQPDPAEGGDEQVRYHCRFLLSGAIADARLVMEPSTIAGDWRLLVNGTAISRWSRALVFDCNNIEADVSQALRSGTPALNVVAIEVRGPGRGLHEVPYLLGSFTCAYHYGHLSFPFIKGGSQNLSLANLQPWDVIGYPTFSGTAVYRRTVEIPTWGILTLDLGRVEDVAIVKVDGQQLAALAWPPYRCSLAGVRPGTHELTIEVTNAPANRTRAARLPAGLLGPVRLLRGG